MHAKPTLAGPSALSTAVAAALATVIAIGILTAVLGLFQSEGVPLEHVAKAERACVQHTYVSEREACVRDWLAASRAQSVASK